MAYELDRDRCSIERRDQVDAIGDGQVLLDQFAGDLLVGNFGDGRINVIDLSTNTFDGQLLNVNGSELSIDGLWGLKVGNNGSAGSSDKLYFSAGPDGETNGLFGVIQSTTVPEPATKPAEVRRRKTAEKPVPAPQRARDESVGAAGGAAGRTGWRALRVSALGAAKEPLPCRRSSWYNCCDADHCPA